MGDLGPTLTVAELRRIVREVEPSAFVVPGRIVRRVIKHHRGLSTLLLRVPHRLLYAIDRDAALEVVDRDELGVQPDEALPSTLILLAEPDDDELADRPSAEILREFWRKLFHSRIHIELEARFAREGVSSVGLRERIKRVGLSTFEEVRSVLNADELLFTPRDDESTFVEFAAVYLSVRAFADHLLPRFFPAIRNHEAIDQLLAEDIDAEALLAATRLPGSAEIARTSPEEEDDPEPIDESAMDHEVPSGPEYRRLLARASLVEGRGNLVRAAILRTHATRLAGPSLAGQARSLARDAMNRLAVRLKSALGFDEARLHEWRLALVAPLERSSRGFWTPEARLLYDLQKVCVDHERPFYAVDLVEWALSFGRRPIKRLLPNHQHVLMMQHLQGAARHLAAARLPDADRARFSRILTEAVHRAEEELRDRFRPEIVKVLDQTGFEARDLPERVALQKINEELLDRVVHRGFLSMGDLRDALSRNNRKLPDLAGPAEFFQGDRLLKANRRLALAMDGVYHRGEVYLRVLQRLSSLAFGTRTGRLLTRYLILPYGGAAVILEGLQHVVIGPISKWVIGDEMHLLNPISLAIDGTVAIGLLYSKEYRQAFGRYLALSFQVLQHLLIGVPSWVLRRDWLRRIFASPVFSLAWRGAILPLSLAGMVYSIRPASVSPIQSLAASSSIFLATSLLLTTRAGRNLEEMTLDSLGRTWSWLVSSLVPGLFRLVMDLFGRVLEGIERVIYTVDEWLRFRGGQGTSSLASKAILGLAWFFIAYVVRFVVTLLIEPQVNPIKHFPVVTVSHKIMLTQLFRVEAVMNGLFGSELGPPIAWTVLGLTPGIFGFLVWELKENWRLYEANRPGTLRPVVIGHHGETMSRLLKPGFHSGTVPKVFAKLRRAERRALVTGHGKWARKQMARLHGVEEDVRHFVDRDFLTILLQSRSLGSTPLAIGAVVPGTKRFLIEVIRPGRPGPGLWLSFEEHSGWLVAGIFDPGWLPELDPTGRDAFASALMGLYKMAGVQLVREPIIEALGPEPPLFDFREEGLVVWPSETTATEILYLLRPAPGVPPLVTINDAGDPVIGNPPRLDTGQLLFSNVEIAWKDWVELWESDRAGRDLSTGLIAGHALLPAISEESGLGTEDSGLRAQEIEQGRA